MTTCSEANVDLLEKADIDLALARSYDLDNDCVLHRFLSMVPLHNLRGGFSEYV